MSRPRSSMLALALALTACAGGGSAAPDAGGVRIESTPVAMTVTNTGSTPLHYVAVPQSRAPLFDPYLCVDEATCPGIPAGSSETKAWSAFGSTVESQYLVITWRALPGPAFGPVVADVRNWTIAR